jgi:hypothetical protein
MELTGHSGKHDLVCVSRAGGDPEQDSNEIGKWSGSLAQSTDVASSTTAVAMRSRHGGSSSEQDSAELAMVGLYSAESVEEIVPDIMRRQILRLQALVVSPGIDALPAKGGWRHTPRHSAAHDIGASHATSHPPVGALPESNTQLALIPSQPAARAAAEPSAQPTSSVGARNAHPPSAKRMRHASARAQLAIIPYQRSATAAGAKEQERPQRQAPTSSLPSGHTRSRRISN